jgi:hypothetical protein
LKVDLAIGIQMIGGSSDAFKGIVTDFVFPRIVALPTKFAEPEFPEPIVTCPTPVLWNVVVG